MDFPQFVKHASAVDECFSAKFAVYEDLRERGLIPKTGFKFGSHFRVYEASCDKHSAFLVHVLPAEHTFSTHELARAVRLAHGVRKRMLFAFIRNGGVKYVEVARKKL
nr:tRNA-intron lyase [Methanophagales archaeon]